MDNIIDNFKAILGDLVKIILMMRYFFSWNWCKGHLIANIVNDNLRKISPGSPNVSKISFNRNKTIR